MDKISFVFLSIFIIGLTGCDGKKNFNKPNTDQRTMVIGGVPAFDQDYQIALTQDIKHTK